MDEYSELVKQALTELGGAQRYVPGAKLLQRVQALAQSREKDFLSDLRAERVRFSQYLSQLGSAIKVHKRGASDMLVGYDTATLEIPQSHERRYRSEFRPDVYNAFSRSHPAPVVYDKQADRFGTQPAEDGIPGPSLIRQDFLNWRREFVSDLRDMEQRSNLETSLMTDSPLTNFRKELAERGLTTSWQDFKNQKIRSAIEKWAADSSVAIRESWFMQPPKSDVKGLLASVAEVMTEEEVRELAIPIRAIEAYLKLLK